MPLLSPNHVKALKGKCITFHGPAHPKLTWGFPTISLANNGSWLPWGRIAKPLSALCRQYPIYLFIYYDIIHVKQYEYSNKKAINVLH